MFIWKKGLFGKRILGKVSFAKWLKVVVGGSLRNKREGRGFWAKSPLFFLLPPGRNRGRGLGASAAPIPVARGSGVAPG